MSLFGSAKSGKTANTKVTLVNAGNGGITLVVNGVPYGTLFRGQTRDKDWLLLNNALSEEQLAEAVLGLTLVACGETPQEVAESIDDFREWNRKQ